jgi:hypothetical protein
LRSISQPFLPHHRCILQFPLKISYFRIPHIINIIGLLFNLNLNFRLNGDPGLRMKSKRRKEKRNCEKIKLLRLSVSNDRKQRCWKGKMKI